MCSVQSTIYIVKPALFITKAAIFHNNIQSALCIGQQAMCSMDFTTDGVCGAYNQAIKHSHLSLVVLSSRKLAIGWYNVG